MQFDDSPEPVSFEPLRQAFRDQLIACLEECAAGRPGLFSNLEHAGVEDADQRPWPEAASLRELAFALQAIASQADEEDALSAQFLDLCSIHGENNPGEPRLARAFLEHIATGQSRQLSN